MNSSDRLVALWSRRDGLSQDEWTELYQLIVSILKRSNPSILRSLPESKEHYIQDFFLHKVFEPAKHGSSCPHGENELCSYFNNYLIDVYRSPAVRTTDFVEDFDHVERCCEEAHVSDKPGSHDFFEYGFSQQDVHLQARKFLDNLDEVGRLYLALNACADVPEPLYKLAERMRIASHHYRAHILGITRKRGEFSKGYEKTQIGSWLNQKLGLEITPSAEVFSALKILCFESLLMFQEQGVGK